jgi:hypothetical protein
MIDFFFRRMRHVPLIDLSSKSRRFRHGIQDIRSPCFMCLQEEDCEEHFLIQCVVAREVWYNCRLRLELDYEHLGRVVDKGALTFAWDGEE